MSRPTCSKRPRRVALAAVVGVALGFALMGCSDPVPPPPPVDTASLPIPAPDLGQIEPQLRQAIQDLSDQIAAQATAGETDTEELAKAFGALGQLYHTYELKDAALICYDNASRLTADDYKWQYLSAYLIQHDGRLEEAAERYARALEAEPESVPALIRSGDLQLELGAPEEARDYYSQALSLDSGAASAIFGRGRAFLAEGNAESARADFERVLELEPSASIVHFQLARALRSLGDAEGADHHLALRGNTWVPITDAAMKELLDIRTLTGFRVIRNLIKDPGDITPVELMGFTLTHLGEHREAVGFLEGVLVEARQGSGEQNRLERARLHYLLGALRVFHDQDEIGMVHFSTATELDPHLIDAYVKLGNAQARAGRLAESDDTFTRALEVSPDAFEIRLKRATVRLNMSRFEEAQSDFREVLRRDPGNPTVRVRLAETLEASGSPELAAKAFEESLAGDFSDAEKALIHRGFGDFLLRRREPTRAMEEYRSAVDLDRALTTAHAKLAGVLGLLGRYEEAAAEYRLVVYQQPGKSEPRLKEAAALILDGRYAEARKRLEEAVATLPESVALSHQLARLLAAAPDADVRDGILARQLAFDAYQASPGPWTAETLAMAYAEQGRFEDAQEWQSRAIEESTAASGPELRQRYDLYQNRTPYRVESPDALLIPLG